MRQRAAGRCLATLVAVGLGLVAGCFGLSQNPSYFPNLLPTEDIVRTHAKPIWPGYFDNFDPHAVRLEVRPVETTNPVRSQLVVVATVYDENGKPRRHRRVEWMLEGAGNIVEVDESGILPGRGYKVDNKYAVSYTGYLEHRITRGTPDPNDDFMIRPGQTWCVITSAVEGDTHVTAYAPEIANWDHHKVFVTNHWLDADWSFPPPSVNRVGSESMLTTRLLRHTDRQPLAGYRVRYRVLDGPPALFMPAHAQEFVVTSDLAGNAPALLVQAVPQPGISRIGIEVIRPPDPSSPSGVGLVIARGETTLEWQGARLVATFTGPAAAGINQEITYQLTIANTGQVDVQAVTVRDLLPAALKYIRSDPPGTVDANLLTWTLGLLPGGRSHTIQLVARGTQVGPVTNCMTVTGVDGFKEERCVTTQVGQPQVAQPPPAQPQAAQLVLTMNDIPTAGVGMPIAFQVAVTNPGTIPATGVVLSAGFDVGLEHESKANPLELRLGAVGAGERRLVPLTLTARRAGQFITRISASADGNLKAAVERTTTVQAPRATVSVKTAKAYFVDQAATWEITVSNPGGVPLTNVVVRNSLPPEVSYLSSSDLGQMINGQVVWNLGPLGANEQKTVQVSARCLRVSQRAVNTVVMSADPNVQEQGQASLEIRGVPAFALDIAKTGDPAQVGGKVTYKVMVTNTGSLPARQTEITAFVPKELQITGTDGPTKGTVAGNRVLFPAVDSVAPKQVLTYVLACQAAQPGDVRFRIELRSQALVDPVVKEESTSIYPPANGK